MTNSDGHINPTADAVSQELLNLAWDLSESVISEADHARLNDLLLESPTNRATYAEFMQLIAFMEHGRDQSTQGDVSDAGWIFDVDSTSILRSQKARPEVIPQPARVPSSPSPSRTSAAAATAACAAVCMLLVTFSILWFVPHPGQTASRSVKETKIAKTDGQHPLIPRNGNELSPENDPHFQKQLDELVQMSSGGP